MHSVESLQQKDLYLRIDTQMCYVLAVCGLGNVFIKNCVGYGIQGGADGKANWLAS